MTSVGLASGRGFIAAVFGPTGIGKSAVAEIVAERTGAVLVSADAFQVYKGLDIGTNKPVAALGYRLTDVVEPTESFGLGAWTRLAKEATESAAREGRPVVVVGGTGLYLRALTENYSGMHGEPDEGVREFYRQELAEHGPEHMADLLRRRSPETAERTDLKNPVRVLRALEKLDSEPLPPIGELPFPVIKFGLETERAKLFERIAERTQAMLDRGWLEETRLLLESGVPIGAPGLRAIGYQSLVRVLKGDLTLDQARADIVRETCRYARRQATWMRSEPDLNLVRVDPLGAEGESGAASAILAQTVDRFGI